MKSDCDEVEGERVEWSEGFSSHDSEHSVLSLELGYEADSEFHLDVDARGELHKDPINFDVLQQFLECRIDQLLYKSFESSNEVFLVCFSNSSEITHS